MGIPKLSRDLAQFGESIILGATTGNESRISVERVVIDGPALVYFIYHRLLACANESIPLLDAQPSYVEISNGVIRFLTELQARNVEIERIYFDGGLPLAKRGTRLKRLEKGNVRLHSLHKSSETSYKAPTCKSTALKAPDANSAYLFDASSRSPSKLAALPPPSFMVAAVIEDLSHLRPVPKDFGPRHSSRTVSALQERDYYLSVSPDSGSLVHVIPGEADAYCAAHAKRTGAGVLSNDSDILVHDLGDLGSLLSLSSLEVSEPPEESDKPVITCNRFSPRHIARRLQLDSISKLAFHRSLDNSAPHSVVLQRARQPLVGISIERCHRFMGQYETPVITDRKFPMLEDLDPRISEIFLQFRDRRFATSSDPHMYLPIILENPSRTASWTYGSNIRRLAYSLLNLSVPVDARHSYVLEYQRRGNSVNAVTTTLMTLSESVAALSNILITMRTIDQAYVSEPDGQALYWRLFSLYQVGETLKHQGKPQVSIEWTKDFIVNGYVGDRLTWDDIHAYANIQAVMYSVRILKQLVHVTKSLLAQELSDTLEVIERFWVGMPSVSQLFVSTRDFRRYSQSSLPTLRAVESIYRLLDSDRD